MGASEMPRTLGCVLLLLYVEDQFCNRERPGAVDLRHLSTQHFAEKERNTQRTLSFQAQTTGDSIPNTTRAGRARAARCSLPTCPVGSWNRIRKAHRFLDPAGAPVAAALPVRAPRLLAAAAALRSPRLPCVPLPAICRSYTVNVGLRTAAVGTTRGMGVSVRPRVSTVRDGRARARGTAQAGQRTVCGAPGTPARSPCWTGGRSAGARGLRQQQPQQRGMREIKWDTRWPRQDWLAGWHTHLVGLAPPGQSRAHRPSLGAARPAERTWRGLSRLSSRGPRRDGGRRRRRKAEGGGGALTLVETACRIWLTSVSSSQFTLRDEPSGSARRTVKNAGSIAVAAEGPRLQLQPARRLIADDTLSRASHCPSPAGLPLQVARLPACFGRRAVVFFAPWRRAGSADPGAARAGLRVLRTGSLVACG